MVAKTRDGYQENPDGGKKSFGDIGRLLDLDEIAEFLHRPARSVRRLVHDGGLPAFRVGRMLRFDRARVQVWLDSECRVNGNNIPDNEQVASSYSPRKFIK